MFRGKKEKETIVGKGDIKAFLGAGSCFEGKLVFDDVVRLDGDFSGEVVSKGRLVIGESATVKAEIEVESLTISGTFKGNIKARRKVELKSPARVEGNLETPMLSIEEGVVLNGTVIMSEKNQESSTPFQPAAEKED